MTLDQRADHFGCFLAFLVQFGMQHVMQAWYFVCQRKKRPNPLHSAVR